MLAKNSHARAWRAILVDALSERHLKMQSVYFGYCLTSLKAENVTILPIVFYKLGGFTRLCCNLAIGVKIARFIPFLMEVKV